MQESKEKAANMCVCACVPHPVGLCVMKPVGISSALIDQVKLMFVGHTNHIIIFPGWTVHQRHHHRRVAQTDLLMGAWYTWLTLALFTFTLLSLFFFHPLLFDR